MQPLGSDRIRVTGGKIILFSRISKGWVPRVPRTNTSAEHPGTAVQWEDGCFEVVAAEPMQDGGVRYLLEPWREEHAMRQVDRYDAETEAARAADFARVVRQRKQGLLVRLSAILLGNLPAPVQNHFGSELGISPPRMTILSTLPAVALFSYCVWRASGVTLGLAKPGVPIWLWIVTFFWMIESYIRFQVAMAQARPMGSLAGSILYSLLWAMGGPRLGLISPFPPPDQRLRSASVLEPSDEVRFQDSLTMREPLLTLLSADDQRRLEKNCGFDHRRHAMGVALLLFAGSLAGVISLWNRVMSGTTVSETVSFALAAAIVVDQTRRLVALRSGPSGSILAPLIRPFARDLLERP